MTKTYITNVIKKSDIGKWIPGQRVLITAPTGSGKSQLVKNVIYEHAKEMGWRVLLLSNRRLLKNQNIEDLTGKEDVVIAKNYQQLEKRIEEGDSFQELFYGYDMVVFDECHYFFSDAAFNRNTDMLMPALTWKPDDKILLFMTATPEIVLKHTKDFSPVYQLPKDYSYLENIYYFNQEETIENILYDLPPEDKAIIFMGSAEKAFRLHEKFNNSSFVCSTDNAKFKDKSNIETSNGIAETGRFEERFLFTTKVLDNGVNIVDAQVRHIIIDMMNMVDFIQCLGRKRIVEGEKINLYFRNYNRGNVSYSLTRINDSLASINDFLNMEKEEFAQAYKRKEFDEAIHNDITLNQARLTFLLWNKEELEGMMVHLNGFLEDVSLRLTDEPFPEWQKESGRIKCAELYFEKKSLSETMELFVGRKLFKEEREIFKSVFFEKVVSVRKETSRQGKHSILNILEENNMDGYEIYSHKETSGDRRNETYWTIKRK